MKHDININGYECFSAHLGIYSFQKKVVNKWALVECTEKQLHNGDIEFMTKNDLTISSSKKKSFQKSYKGRQN